MVALRWRGVWSAGLLALMVLLLAACGGADEAPEDDGAAAEDAPAVETEAPEEPAVTEPMESPAETETGDAQGEVEQVTLPVVQSVDSLTFLPVYAALTQGFYDEAGIELEITLGGVGGREIQALLGGEVDIAFSAGTELVKVAAQGRDIIAVQGMGEQSSFAAMIRADLAEEVGLDESWSLEERLALLEGRTVGISSPGALSDTIARYWIQQAGFSDAEVEIVATGPPTGGVAALQQGDVDFLMSWAPFSEQIAAEGFGEYWIDARTGIDPSLEPWLEQTIVTTDAYAQENPDIVSRLVQATTRGNEWILENDVEAIVDMVLTLEPFQALDREVVTPAVEAMQQSFTPDGTITAEQLENVERVLTVGEVINEEINAEEHFDNSYLEG